MIKAIQVIEAFASATGGGVRYYKPYDNEDTKDFKVLWPRRKAWLPHELEAMISLFGTGFVIVDEEGQELRRIP